MRFSIVGLGYVGLVTSAGLSEWEHDVVGIEASTARLTALQSGRMPFFEPRLDEFVERHTANGRLRFVATEEAAPALAASDVVTLAVGTHDGNGGWQTATMAGAIEMVVPVMADDSVLVIRSTLPPEYVAELPKIVREIRRRHGKGAIPILLNPEFTQEGRAVHDFLHPDRVVLGLVDDPERIGLQRMRGVYARAEAPIVVLEGVDAAMSKLGANLFLATKISFANELAGLCDRYGADVDEVVSAMAHDTRIGGQFLRAGVGFGGSCLPHQVSMTVRTAQAEGIDVPLLQAVDEVNHRQRLQFVDALMRAVDGVASPRIALLGVTFKPNTDDLRDAPALTIARELLDRGARVVAYDPMHQAVEAAAAEVLGLEIATTAVDAARGADAIGLVTEWSEFKNLDWTTLRAVSHGSTVVDGRNALSAKSIAEAGFAYRAFGRRNAEPVEIPIVQDLPVAIPIASSPRTSRRRREAAARSEALADNLTQSA